MQYYFEITDKDKQYYWRGKLPLMVIPGSPNAGSVTAMTKFMLGMAPRWFHDQGYPVSWRYTAKIIDDDHNVINKDIYYTEKPEKKHVEIQP